VSSFSCPRAFRFLLLLGWLTAALALAAAGPVQAAPPHADVDRDGVFENLEAKVRDAPADGELAVIVVLRRDATAARVGQLEDDFATLDAQQRFTFVDGFAGVVDANEVRDLAAAPEVAHVELDAPVHAFNASAQSSFGVTATRTAVPGLDGDGDSSTAYSASDLVAAVIDTGVDDDHVTLDGGKVLAFQDFTESTYDAALDAAYDDDGHGTHIAATIAGDGDGDADGRGVAPGAGIVGLKVLDANGSGYTSDVIAAIEWARTNRVIHGIEVINMSLGSDGCSDGADAEADAVDAAVAAGIVVAVAAGNEGAGRCTIGSPGAVESAITVGAMADQGVGGFYMADFSSRGTTLDGRIKPDIVAPGVRIRSARANTTNGFTTFSGTSVASPFVAGVALLMRDQNPALTPAAIKQTLRSTAVDWGRGGIATTAGTTGPDIDHGAGRLDAHAALAAVGAAVGPAPAVPAHALVEGSLAGTGAVVSYRLTASGSAFPLAVSLSLAGDDRDGDGRSDDANADGCHDVNFDAYLYDGSGTLVQVYDRRGTASTAATGCLRSDAFWRPAGAPTEYTLKIVSDAGAGEFFLDVSGGSAVAFAAPGDGAPSVTGEALVGSVLTAVPSTWSGTVPMSFGYRWQRCSSDGTCQDIAGATSTEYRAVSDDVGSALQVTVAATNAAGTGSATSPRSAVVPAPVEVAVAESVIPQVDATVVNSDVAATTTPPAEQPAVITPPVGPTASLPKQTANRASIRIACHSSCTAGVTIKAPKALARRLHLQRRTVGSTTRTLAAGTRIIRVAISRTMLRKLRAGGIRRPRLSLLVRVKDADGLVTSLRRSPRIPISKY